MDKGWLFVALIGITLVSVSVLTPALAGREMSIPPTNAFSKIIIGNKTITANDYSSAANLTDKIAGNVIGAGSLSCSALNGTTTCKITAISCPVLQGIKGVDSNGNLFCSTL